MSNGVTIAVPANITDANIVGISGIDVDNDFAAWSAGTTYALNAKVVVSDTDIHRIYNSVVGGNVGNDPLDEADLNDPQYWSLVGATNAYKMFDSYVSTQTVGAGSFTFTLQNLGQVNTFGLFGLIGDAVTLVVKDQDDNLISTETRDLISYATFNSFYDWFFTPFLNTEFLVFENIPPYYNAKFTVTITGAVVGIGAVVPAYGYGFLGLSRASSVNPKDYSIKTELTPGVFEFQKGPSTLECELDFNFPAGQIDLLNRIVKQRFGLPTLVIGNSDFESFTHYGNIYASPNNLPYADEGNTRLKVESLF